MVGFNRRFAPFAEEIKKSLDSSIPVAINYRINAGIVTALDVAQLICAIVYFWGGRGRAWPIWASLAVALAVEVQVGMGFERLLVVHLPLGVSLTVAQILITVWLFRPAAAAPRPRRVRRIRRARRARRVGRSRPSERAR